MQLTRPTPAPEPWAEPFFTVGITGTNGKTSTTHLVAACMTQRGSGVATVSTLGSFVDGEEVDEPRSHAGFLRTLRRVAERGGNLAAVECTSMALSQGYAKRWRFDCGVFTNLSPEHLATHQTYEHYLASKAQLFIHLGPGCTAVLNAGDEHALLLDQAIPPDVVRLWYHAPSRGPALRAADLQISDVELDVEGTRARLKPSPIADWLGGTLEVSLVGDVFAENALAAALAARTAGVDASSIVAGLRACPPLPGRFQILHRDPIIAVDYAHTPDALEHVLSAARKLTRGRLSVVFGAGGGSGAEKREPMGEVVGRLADHAVITSDNPRNEDPAAIADALRSGCTRGGRATVTVELDRTQAIERALMLARSGDVVVIAGKGHERGQEVAGEVIPYSDVQEVERILGVPDIAR